LTTQQPVEIIATPAQVQRVRLRTCSIALRTKPYVVDFQLGTSSWEQVAMRPIEINERIGNARDVGGDRYFVITQKPVALDPYTYLKLRVLAGNGSWDVQDRMAAINAAQIPDLGVLTRDGLTLISSAVVRGVNTNYDLYVSSRTTIDDAFPVGAPSLRSTRAPTR
jgi:hypothetical protein